MTDKFEIENVQIGYCPTYMMWEDFMTRSTQVAYFREFINYVLCGMNKVELVSEGHGEKYIHINERKFYFYISKNYIRM